MFSVEVGNCYKHFVTVNFVIILIVTLCNFGHVCITVNAFASCKIITILLQI